MIRNNTASDKSIGILLYYSSNKAIYNNFFNNSNFVISASISNWNITKTPGMNIIGGSYLSGNVWANPSGTGFSQTCIDSNSDAICDSSYTLDGNNIAYKSATIGTETVGVYRNVFYPRNSNDAGNADLKFAYGQLAISMQLVTGKTVK